LNVNTKVTKDNVASLLRSLQELARRDVLVGITEERSERDDPEAGTLGNASLAYIHEHGSVLNSIPARPFLEPGIQDARDILVGMFEQAAQAALNGKEEVSLRALDKAGLVAQNAVRAKITAGPFTPLAASTLASRRRRGRTGTKPLIDTGQLRNSITYVVREK
jgi:phage gpG-like protein